MKPEIQSSKCQTSRTHLTFARVLVVAIAALQFSTPTSAQSNSTFEAKAKGFQPNRDYVSLEPFEHIDTVSGNLILTFSDLVLPGNVGRELRFQRTYNSRMDKPGWTFGLAGIVMSVVDSDPNAPPFGTVCEECYLPHLLTADGADHPTIWLNPPSYTTDGHRWVVTAQFWRYDRLERKVYMPDGTICRYDTNGNLIEIRDAFANAVALTWTPSSLNPTSLQIIQQVGTNQREIMVSGSLAEPTSVSYLGKTWSYEWTTIYYGTVPVPVLTRVILPVVGLAWEYAYDPVDLVALRHLRTPAGGEIAYSYGIHQFGREQDVANQIQVNSRVVTSRAIVGSRAANGTWAYAYRNGTPEDPCPCERTTVTTPSSTLIEYRNEVLGIGYSPTLGGDFGLKQRSVTSAQGQLLETETRNYTQLAVIGYVVGGTPETSQRAVNRDGRQYTAAYTYASTNFGDYHRANTITETGELSRTTTRAYDYNFNSDTNGEPYFNGQLGVETVSVNGESFTTSFGWNHATGFLQQHIAYGLTTSFEPDAYGNVARVTKGNGTSTSFSYAWGVVNGTTTAAHVTTRVVNPEGTIASATQAGRTTTFIYDDLLRVTRTDPPGGTNAILTSYNNTDGSTVTVQRGPSTVTTTLDGFGRPISSSNSVGIQTRTTYDAEGRKIYDGYPFSGADPNTGTTIAYDALGRVTGRTNPDNTYQALTYGPGTVTVRDENGHETVQTTQAFGDPTDVLLAQVRDADQKTWVYNYNVLGKLAGVQAPDGTTRSWTYDSRNLLKTESHPESGTVTYNSYDGAGNLQRKTDARGTGFVYGYDANDRVVTMLSGGQFASMTYESGSDRRRSAAVGTASSTFTYDGAGRLASRDDVVDGRAFVRVFEYDGNDNLTGITYPSGRHVTIGRDPANRITQIRDVTFGRDIATAFDYHPSGAVAGYTSGNGILNQITFDQVRYWPTSITAGPLGLTYVGHDAVGNITSIGDSRGAGFGQTFTYDALDRLRTAVGPYGSQPFEYDAHGNRNSAGGTTYQYQSLRLVNQGGMPYSYDNNGNLATGPNAIYTYTPDNMLESATLVGSLSTYAYDADRWRIKTVTSTGTSYFLRGPGGELLTEVQNPGTPSVAMKDYIYAGDRLVAVIAVP